MFKTFLSLCLVLIFCTTSAYSQSNQKYSILANDPNLLKAMSFTFEFHGEKMVMNPWSNESVRIDFDKSTIYISGIDNIQTYEDIDDAVKALTMAGKKEIIFNLHSPGGSVFIMNLIIIEMDILKSQGVKVITQIDENNSCMSACTLIFLNGDVRVAHRKSVFMFHSPRVASINSQSRKALQIIVQLDIAAIREEFKQVLTKHCGPKSPLINDVYDGQDHYYPSKVLQQVCPAYITKLVGMKRFVDPNKGF